MCSLTFAAAVPVPVVVRTWMRDSASRGNLNESSGTGSALFRLPHAGAQAVNRALRVDSESEGFQL